MAALHIVSILDRSGSMGGTEKEVIGAYNAFIAEQKKIAHEKSIKSKVSLVLFDNQYEEVYSKIDINDAPVLDEKTYYTRGMTALMDAIGKTIVRFEGKKKVIFFIETDGHENASQEFTRSKLKELIEKKKKDGWDFNFVGADLDSMTTISMAESFGIDINKTMAFDKSKQGYSLRNALFASATMAYVDKDSVTN
jgi:hypothetical protein